MEEKEKKDKMVNITINYPHIYEENIQKLIKLKIIPSRSEGIRLALRDFLHNEYEQNLKLLGYFETNSKKKVIIIKRKKVDWNTPEINLLNQKLGEKR